MSDFKTAKDTLVASLFELSKAAQEAATAAVDFYKLAHVDDEQINEALKSVGQVADLANGHKELADIAAAAVTTAKEEKDAPKKKKKKVERDPNAPKKPLTMYFAFQFHTRKEIADERKKKGLPSLSAIDMNSIIKERWANISDKEKETWKQKYSDELKVYNVEKEKYQSGLTAAGTGPSSVPVETPVLAAVEDAHDADETKSETPKKAKKRKSDKEKSEKSEKKEKKKKLATASSSD
ncbi:uncharacterized protein SPAPADRAFT_49202 [Spathaspora passalidarum NRRL Y-27907]|uniref:HMG box domain-containing protein n=1 Tax=Spathaspora passalidarum (strain NRRL Y-27907 / 11-Y1) TaxID=619300 RepID=G3AHG9_SPAPN|nr:uncharacterized protein SPAPADRAFT_49202 [Spathaspora passalidarum NRRL Y-27907]EGW34134.1 hypothetical protein SPAPADRAFT_49202 [Spathaspora passalidarum NRRL Y-27907]